MVAVRRKAYRVDGSSGVAPFWIALMIVGALFMSDPARPASAIQCPNGGDETLPTGGAGEDLEVVGNCQVGPGLYQYGNVNVFGTKDNPATLRFKDADIEFWARSMLVENFGSVLAGAPASLQRARANPIGPRAHLTIVLYGKADDPPIACKSPGGICGADPAIWSSNGPGKVPVKSDLPGGVNDYFYNYDFMTHHVGPDAHSRFGSKVLAVSYGGTLRLVGKRGTIAGKDDDPSESGRSWGRLEGSLAPGADTLVVDGVVDWTEGDHIVVTTTDYMPGHSEELIVQSVTPNAESKTTKITFTNADPSVTGMRWHHYGERYALGEKAHPGIGRLDLNIKAVDTRAAVGLLSRSIRILSGGDDLGAPFPPESTGYAHGGHTMARQGFKTFQVQGVEFFQLGQGGAIGHYPIHFHLARKTPDDTWVKDCSIHDSMTRWITLHGTQNVLLARNVGYKSIGHGFYLESGTEADNQLFSSLGVLARAAIDNPQNPRKVPGILAAAATQAPHRFPYHSDAENPTVFWIMNGWNDFKYNMAAGAGTCGACYWLLPGFNSGQENTDSPSAPYARMAWRGYAAMQRGVGRAGMTPLKSFVGNTCTAAMNSFQTVGEIAACNGVAPLVSPDDKEHLAPIPNPLAPLPHPDLSSELYYPRIIAGGSRPATRCGDEPRAVKDLDCGDDAKFLKCASNPSPPLPPVENRPTTNCMVTVLDRYTTSFNWAATNFAAVWLRQFWYLLSNSAITDVQNGGLTFVTGGDYTRSSVIDGFWAVATKSAFVGETQKPGKGLPPVNPFASALGPFNPTTGLECPINDPAKLPEQCIARDDGVLFQVANFASNQRLFSVYDGPSYQDSNAYLDIEPSRLPDLFEHCAPTQADACPKAVQLYGRGGGIPKDADDACYLPNAAIGWKQPNGFFYPPAFHSRNLFFDNAEIRHFVIEPEFVPGTLTTDQARVEKRYCSYPKPVDPNFGLFQGFTAVDRQTVLNDDDGTLTGLVASVPRDAKGGAADKEERETISVNFDDYFDAPIEALECGSDVANPPEGFSPGTAKTSPYDYLTTVVYPACARLNGPTPPEKGCGYTPTPPPIPVPDEPQQNPLWASDCTTGTCYGVPLYRQKLRRGEARSDRQRIQMMGADLWQRSSLTTDNGTYYIDTAKGVAAQAASKFKNVFEAGSTYYVFFVYAKPTTSQVYQLWVGAGQPENFAETNVFPTRALPNVSHFEFRDDSSPWPSTWTRHYDSASGILTVTIDMGFDAFREEFERAERDFCLPNSFCKFQSGACTCKDDAPTAALCKDSKVCSRWAGKDIDWPDGGAYGFGIKFPSNFVPDDADHRPASSCITKSEQGWNTPLVRVSEKLAGACAETPIPEAQFCE